MTTNACRGRCLPEPDGTANFTNPFNASNLTAFPLTPSHGFANMTERPVSIAALTGGGSDGSGGDGPELPNTTTTSLSSSPSNATLLGRRRFGRRDSGPSNANNDSAPTNASAFTGDNDVDTPPTGLDNFGLPKESGGSGAKAPPTSAPTVVDPFGVPTVTEDADNENHNANGNRPYTPSPQQADYLVFNDSLSTASSSSSSSSSSDSDSGSNPSPTFYCPCNCTYVSAACCLSYSHIVHEDASRYQIPMDPLPEDSPVCCDPNSGLWLPKPSIECERLAAANVSADGFVGLGSVKWDPHSGSSRNRPPGFPQRGAEGHT